jgi:protein disulfide-isomerase A6
MAKISTLLLSLALVAASAAEAVLDLKPDTFDNTVLKSGKPALVEFFAPWCGREYSMLPH